MSFAESGFSNRFFESSLPLGSPNIPAHDARFTAQSLISLLVSVTNRFASETGWCGYGRQPRLLHHQTHFYQDVFLPPRRD